MPSKMIQFSSKGVIGGETSLFAVSKDSANHGNRTFVVKTREEFTKPSSTRFDTSLRANIDALNSVDTVGIKSIRGLNEFNEAVEWVNRKVDRHNNNGLKTFLKFLVVPWLFATLFNSDFFKTFEHVTVKHGISVGFAEKANHRARNESFFNQVMDKLQQGEPIVELDFSNYSLTSKDVTKLVAALRNNNTLRSIIFTQPGTDHDLSKADLQRVCDAIENHANIQSLSFKRYPMTDGKMNIVAGLLRKKTDIKELNFSQTELNANDMEILRRALVNNHGLQVLDLYWNNLYSKGCEEVAELLKTNSSIVSLDIGYNAIAKSNSYTKDLGGVQLLANVLKTHPSLEKLDVRWNALGDLGCAIFGEALQTNQKMKWFDISWNNMGQHAADEFSIALTKHPKLEHISFYWNDLESKGVEAIGRGICNSRSLQHVDLGANGITKDMRGFAFLKEAVEISPVPRSIRYSSSAKYFGALAMIADPRQEVLSWDKDQGILTNR